MRPKGELVADFAAGYTIPEGWEIAKVKFYHPDDVEQNRSQKEILEWPLRMPVSGQWKSMNPNISRKPLLAPDPLYNDWLICLGGVVQYDWNALLTTQEYLDYVERTPNLLKIKWRRSQYATIENIPFLYRDKTPNADRLVRETIEKQQELRNKTTREH